MSDILDLWWRLETWHWQARCIIVAVVVGVFLIYAWRHKMLRGQK